MFEQTIVAYDGSERARAGFAFAARLAGRVGGRLTLARVLESPYESSEPVPGFDPRLDAREREHAEELDALAATVPEGVEVDRRVLHGRPAAALLDLLEELRPDLVVAGSGGVGFGRFLLGSVSQRLLEAAPCDLLLFRWPEVPEGSIDVIAAVDGSEHARHGVAVAERLAVALDGRLVVTHVADYELPFAHNPYRGVREVIRDHGVDVLREARASVSGSGAEVAEDLREGNAREQLIAACEERAPAVAVIGSRGIGGFHGLLVGSTARDLVNHASCPVLVVRGERDS